MERILVTDGEHRAALAVVRSVGAAGYPTFVCSSVRRSLAGSSRYAAGHATVPDPLTEVQEHVRSLAAAVRRWRIDLVVPITDASLLAVLEAGNALGTVRVPFPSLKAFRSISDKERVLAEAARLGIAVPAQTVVRSKPDAERVATLPSDWPVVVKPFRSVTDFGGERIKLGVCHAANAGELARRLDAIPAAAYPLLLQQRVVGPGTGVFMLLWNGRLKAVFAHRRIREKPPAGGVSVYSESVPADSELVEQSRALLDRFGWQGVAMVEYKIDAATGTPYLMEVNGRFWGSLQLASDAGVDFPRLLVEHALGHDPAPVLTYSVTARSRWWWGDVDHLLMRMRRGPADLALPPGAPGRRRVLLDFLHPWRPGERGDVLRLDDPAPFARETVDWFRRLLPRPRASDGLTEES